jgi:hypothetical protein
VKTGTRQEITELFRAAEQMVYRPAVDDSRTLDKHTRELRTAVESARHLIASRAESGTCFCVVCQGRT